MNRTKYLNSEIKRLKELLRSANSDKLKQIIRIQIFKLEQEKKQKQRNAFLKRLFYKEQEALS